MPSIPPLDAPNSAMAQKALFANKFLNDFFDKNKLHVSIKTAHQRKINACTTVPQFQHINNTLQVLDVITNHDIAIEQEKLLANYVQNISSDMVDIDYLTLAVKLSDKDIKRFLSKEEGIQKLRTSARSNRLTVTKSSAENKNQGFKTGDTKPFFTKRYRIIVDNDKYKYINLYYADKANERNAGRSLTHNLEIEFIPSRFPPGMIDLVFLHLKSVFKGSRYPQLVNNARVLQLDLGMNMFGVSQLFCFIDTNNYQIKSGQCHPNEENCLPMTTTIGSHEHSHSIVYDKGAKEQTKFFEEVTVGLQENINDLLEEVGGRDEVYSALLPTARYETSHIDKFYLLKSSNEKRKKSCIKFNQLEQIDPEFSNTIFVRPSVLSMLERSTLKKLVNDKSYAEMAKLRDFFISEDAYLRFDAKQVRSAFLPQLTALKSSITNPQKNEAESGFNYTAIVQEAKQSLLPFQQILHERCSDRDLIIQSEEQNIFVEGTPGSGKTTLMIDRVIHLLEINVPPEEICVLAFTKDASKHFKKELLKKCSSAKRVWVGTFSRWCNQTIKKINALTILNADESNALINRIIDRVGSDDFRERKSLRKKIIRVINYSTNYSKPHIPTSIKKIAPELAKFEESICEIFTHYTEYKELHALQDFNDILLNMHTQLKKPKVAKSIAQKLKYIFLDEAQDSSDVQWKILKCLSQHKTNVFCVGDPAQSMYSFRGAKSAALENFTMMFHHAKKYALRKCYRSNNGIVNFCNAIRKGISDGLSLAISKDESQYLPSLKAVKNFDEGKAELLRDLKKIRRLKPEASILVLSNYIKVVTELEEAAEDIAEDLNITFTNTHKGKGSEADITLVFDTSLGRGRHSTRKQEMCNLYVACSRAKQNLKIYYDPYKIPHYDTSKGQSKKASTINILRDIHESLYKGDTKF